MELQEAILILLLIALVTYSLLNSDSEPCNITYHNTDNDIIKKEDGVYYKSPITGKKTKIRELTESDKLNLENSK